MQCSRRYLALMFMPHELSQIQVQYSSCSSLMRLNLVFTIFQCDSIFCVCIPVAKLTNISDLLNHVVQLIVIVAHGGMLPTHHMDDGARVHM